MRSERGYYYDVGGGALQDTAEATPWYRIAAEQGDARAQTNLGIFYACRRGVIADRMAAMEEFRRAVEKGHADAQSCLSGCYSDRRGVPQDMVEAVKWFRKAAEEGHAVAQWCLGFCYIKGQGVPEDATEAVKWWRKAAEQGNADGQRSLGYCYDVGAGVPQDMDEATRWYRMAAEQGDARAQSNLGLCYAAGQGVPENKAEAVAWFRRAAEQGHAPAQRNLAWCYENGQGVPEDKAEAAKWYRKVVEQGLGDKVELLARKALERRGETGASLGIQQETLLRAYQEFHRAALECRIRELDEGLVALKHEEEAQGFLPQIDVARRAIKAELAALRLEARNPDGDALRRKAESLWSLVTSGEYEEIAPAADRSLTARTSPVTIVFDDWEFALGRYDIGIGPYGTLTIRSADGTGGIGCPHPHITSDGWPCLGTVGPGLRRALGRMRIAEALSAIRVFLGSYNPDSPYVMLTEFDPNHHIRDLSPCDECLGCRSPYCVMDCPRNETGALHSCSECTEYRTEYCYDRCSGNVGFAYVHPCDDCREREGAACAECRWNEDPTEGRPADSGPTQEEAVRNEACAVQPGNPQGGKDRCAPYDDYPDCDDYGECDDCDWVTDDELGDFAPVPLVENGGDLDEYMLSDCEEPGGPCHGCVRWSTPYCLRDCPHNGARASEDEDSPESMAAHATGRQRAGTAHGSVQGCEECVEDATYCFLQCPRNADWSKRSPCSHCRLSDEDDCNGNCPFRARRQELRPWDG